MMNLRQSSAPIVEGPGARGRSEKGLRGARLVIARVSWLVIAVFELGMLAVSLPGDIAQLQTLCTDQCASLQLSVDAFRSLQQAGFSLGDYVALNLVFTIIATLPYFVIATLLVWRRSNDWMALLVSLMLIGFAPSSNPNAVLLSRWLGPGPATTFVSLANQITITSVALAFYLFPDGRFVPRWTRWFAIIGIGISVLFVIVPSAPQSLIGSVLYIAVLVSLVIAQVYRYRRVSTLAQRQQTKWIVYGLAVTIALLVGLIDVPEFAVPALGQNGSLFAEFGNVLTALISILIPLSFGIAILRYRLYDIDILINRTLVYGTLTLSLALVYSGLIIGLESLVGALSGQASQPVVIVISTLVIYVLFQPLRHRIQALIDRRFYRRKYDAARTLEAFSATLRNEVDLEHLSEHLIAVVQETMQPTHVSLWLVKPQKRALTRSLQPGSPHETGHS